MRGIKLKSVAIIALIIVSLVPGVCFSEQKLTTSDGENDDSFGTSVSLSGNACVIGAKGDDSSRGSSYIFRLEGSKWVEQQKLSAGDGQMLDKFGRSVSIDDNVCLVGADSDEIGGLLTGSAYIFRYNGTDWIEQQKLNASDGAHLDFFGKSVSIDSDVCVIGAPFNGAYGAAYIFCYNGSNWIEQQKLTASDKEANDFFGISVCLSGDLCIVGAKREDSLTGSAYIFRYDGSDWIQEQKLTASDGEPGDWFGCSVSIDEDVCVVGAYCDRISGVSKGSVYVFCYNGTNWIEQQRLSASDGSEDDYFGESVSIDPNLCVIGSPYNGSSGSAYLFLYEDGNWDQWQKLTASDGATGDSFGTSVSICGNNCLVGAAGDDSFKGSAYLFNQDPYAKYSGGNGDANNSYLIANANDMNEIGMHPEDWSAHFLMINNVNLADYTGTEFNIIGISSTNAFTGVFDGNGHTISNFTYQSTDTHGIGMFGFVAGPNTVIKNLGLINPDIDACSGEDVGSLIGSISGGKIEKCFSHNGSVTGYGYVGALAGFAGTREQENDDISFVNCYSSTNVSGDYYIGGLIGALQPYYFSGGISVSNCYATGQVNATQAGGGLIGFAQESKIVSSFWDIQGTGQETSSGGVGKTTAQMQSISTFAGWGCDPVWTINDGVDYPRLLWENMPGELITKPAYGGGSGTGPDPYLIYTAEQLNKIGLVSCDLDKHFRLMADLNLEDYNSTTFNIIGTKMAPFTGVFDGNNNEISNFTFQTDNWTECIGLFGYVRGYDAEIRDLGLRDPNVFSGNCYCIGALAGSLIRGTIRNCYVKGGTVSGDCSAGGLAGSSSGAYGPEFPGALIKDCYTDCAVGGDEPAGGLVGHNSSRIYNCYSESNVTGNEETGGLVGYNDSPSAVIKRCYANGTIIGSRFSGGLVGINGSGKIYDSYAKGSVSGTHCIGGLAGMAAREYIVYYPYIYRCYSTGYVNGNSYTGGFIGWDRDDECRFRNCFWDQTVNQELNGLGSGSSDDVTGKTTEQMLMENTFTEAGWNFNTVWKICEGTNYPELIWQIPLPGDFICPVGVDMRDFAVLAAQWKTQRLSCDVYPEKADGLVNFQDWALLAKDSKGTINIDDVAAFVEQWLQFRDICADIAPAPIGDRFVDFRDVAAMCELWMERVGP